MMNIKGIFAVSLIAMVAMVAGAHTSNAVAAIASQGYVDQQVGLKANATDLERKVDIYQGDAKANQAVITNGTGNITTGFITKSMLGADVEIPDEYELPPATANALGGVKSGGNITVATSGTVTVNSATKATQDASGNEITKTYATKNELTSGLAGKEVTSNKVTSTNYTENVSSDTKYPTVKAVADAIADVEKTIPDAITVDSALSSTSTNPVQNKVINTALNAKEVTSNKVTSTNYDANVSSDTKYPTVKAVADAIADVEEKIPAKITVDSALSSTSTNPVQNKVINAALNGKVATAQGPNAVSKAVITNASGNITTGTISSAMITDGTITNADISASAAIAQSKISGLTTALAGKVATAQGSNAVNKAVITDASGNITTGQIASGMIAKDAVTADKIADGVIPTASDILTTTTVTSSGTGAVLTGVSVEDGKVTLQKGNVQIPSGGQNATSYVSIWVE